MLWYWFHERRYSWCSDTGLTKEVFMMLWYWVHPRRYSCCTDTGLTQWIAISHIWLFSLTFIYWVSHSSWAVISETSRIILRLGTLRTTMGYLISCMILSAPMFVSSTRVLVSDVCTGFHDEQCAPNTDPPWKDFNCFPARQASLCTWMSQTTVVWSGYTVHLRNVWEYKFFICLAAVLSHKYLGVYYVTNLGKSFRQFW